MSKPISQREARELRRRVRQLEGEMERQRNVWSSEYPGARIAELLDSAEDSLRFGPNDTIDTVQVRQDRLRAAVRARREWDAK